jgi:hypothetical protein
VPVIAARHGGYSFDREGIRALRRIEALRNVCGDDFAGIKLILELTNALERMRAEMRNLDDSLEKGRANRSPNLKLKTNKRRRRSESN